MSNLSVFQFQSQEIRVIEIDNEPWFVGKDVCDVLEIEDNSSAFRRLKDYEKLTRTVSGSGQNREYICISESGLYRLVMTSRKPQAEPFQDWVCQEVLPSIRKTGGYSQNRQVMEMFKALMEQSKEQQQTIEQVKQQNQLLLADKTETEEIGALVKSEYQGLVQLIQVTFGNISDYYSEKINKLYPQNKGNYYTLRQVAYKFFDLEDSQVDALIYKARCNINGIYRNLTGKYLPCKSLTYVFGKSEILFALWKLVLASEELDIDLGVKFTVEKDIEELERLLNTEDF